ncbi:MAG: enoyl-CoA hydratase, partial [Paraburkholderia fungorum]
ALEFMGFAGPDVREGVTSLRERRAPDFGGADPWSGRPRHAPGSGTRDDEGS